MWLIPCSSSSSSARSASPFETRASAAAPKITRLDSCPVAPNGARPIMFPSLGPPALACSRVMSDEPDRADRPPPDLVPELGAPRAGMLQGQERRAGPPVPAVRPGDLRRLRRPDRAQAAAGPGAAFLRRRPAVGGRARGGRADADDR